MKNILMVLALASISACTYADADEWPDKECNDYSAYIGFLVAASVATMEEASEAKEAGDKAVSEEQFMATHMLAEQAANHTKVFNTFCD
tara:strand:- start:7325 stop:7591 length:267 start_codon:yes stop_codon:yes gene_type:complete